MNELGVASVLALWRARLPSEERSGTSQLRVIQQKQKQKQKHKHAHLHLHKKNSSATCCHFVPERATLVLATHSQVVFATPQSDVLKRHTKHASHIHDTAGARWH
jgi:hypothetical protein